MSKGIIIKGRRITTPVVLSTYGGHWGTGLMPIALSPRYVKFMNLIRETGTTQLAKSSTAYCHRGKFLWYDPRTWKNVQPIGRNRRSLLNSFGHTNLGLSLNLRFIRIAIVWGFKVIVNFAPDFSKSSEEVIAEALFAVAISKKILGDYFVAIEIVPSCGNRKYCVSATAGPTADIIRAIKKVFPEIIVMVKKNKDHKTEDVIEWEMAGMDILHGINTVFFETVYPGWESPLADVGGGCISGEDITKIALEDNLKSRKATKAFMIFGGGNMTVDDIQRCFDCGADSASICTVASIDTPEAEKIIRMFNS
jgi:dihydroorotate dehydrogenase